MGFHFALGLRDAVWPIGDSFGQKFSVRTFKQSLIQDAPAVVRTPLPGQHIAHLPENRCSFFRLDEMGEIDFYPVGKYPIVPYG